MSACKSQKRSRITFGIGSVDRTKPEAETGTLWCGSSTSCLICTCGIKQNKIMIMLSEKEVFKAMKLRESFFQLRFAMCEECRLARKEWFLAWKEWFLAWPGQKCRLA